MKRRRDSPDTLKPETLRTCPADDPRSAYLIRKRRFDDWLDEREAWIARRKEYSAKIGWPGGDDIRAFEEDELHPVPDSPFDPEWEIAHGDL